MGKTKIEWATDTWSPVAGCSQVSPGCLNCYAIRETNRHRNLPKYAGLVKDMEWTGEVRCHPDLLDQPLRWTKPRMIFVCSMSDLFHSKVPWEFIDQVFAVMALSPQHVFQLLSKRPGRMAYYTNDPGTPKRVATQAALLYNVRYEQRASYPILGLGRRIGDRFSGSNLESGKAAWPRGGQGRGIRAREHDKSMSESQGGISESAGLSANRDDDPGSSDGSFGSPRDMDLLQWANPEQINNQPQEWGEGRQSALQSGTSNLFRTETPCFRSPSDKEVASEGFTASQDSSYRSGCAGDQAVAGRRDDGQGPCGTIQDYQKGNVFDLLPENLASHLTWPLPNVWFGTSVESQKYAPRLDCLARVPAKVRFVSCEPLLGPLDLRRWLYPGEGKPLATMMNTLSWTICGGESGPGARPMHPDWARSLRDQCQAAGVPYFFKQWGEWKPVHEARFYDITSCVGYERVGKKAAGAVLDGREHKELPYG